MYLIPLSSTLILHLETILNVHTLRAEGQLRARQMSLVKTKAHHCLSTSPPEPGLERDQRASTGFVTLPSEPAYSLRGAVSYTVSRTTPGLTSKTLLWSGVSIRIIGGNRANFVFKTSQEISKSTEVFTNLFHSH